jgi:hypothetical protein
MIILKIIWDWVVLHWLDIPLSIGKIFFTISIFVLYLYIANKIYNYYIRQHPTYFPLIPKILGV